MKEDEEDVYFDDNEDYSESERPTCPYCDDSDVSCAHLVIDYDASFNEVIGGYLKDEIFSQIEEVNSIVFPLLKSGANPKLKAGSLKDILNYAFENFDESSGEIDLDFTAFVNLLENWCSECYGESFRYSDEDSSPGYSSAYIIIFAAIPSEFLKNINKKISFELS